MKTITWISLMLLAAAGASAGDVPTRQADVGISRTVDALLAGMSGEEGEDRDWQAWADLFVPGAVFRKVGATPRSLLETRTLGVPEWIVGSGLGLNGKPFVEEAIHSVTETYGGIASVFVTYIVRTGRGGPEIARGAASLHLVETNDGWKVVSWIWTGEQENDPLPARYLP